MKRSFRSSAKGLTRITLGCHPEGRGFEDPKDLNLDIRLQFREGGPRDLAR